MKSRLEGIVERRDNLTQQDRELIDDLDEACRAIVSYGRTVVSGQTVEDWARDVDAVVEAIARLVSDDGLDL